MEEVQRVQHGVAERDGQIVVVTTNNVHHVRHDDTPEGLHAVILEDAQSTRELGVFFLNVLTAYQVHFVQITVASIVILADQQRHEGVLVDAHVGLPNHDVDLRAIVPETLKKLIGFHVRVDHVRIPNVRDHVGLCVGQHVQIFARVVVHLHDHITVFVGLDIVRHDVVFGEDELLLQQHVYVPADETHDVHPVAFHVAKIGSVVLVLHQHRRGEDHARVRRKVGGRVG